jgi:hypothetical protein
METIVIARNRFRMYTAFVTADGRRILNIATQIEGRQQCVSIAFDEADESGIVNEDPVVIERLLIRGRRLPEALPTPSAGVPVSGRGFDRAA